MEGLIVALALATAAAGCHRERGIKTVTADDGSAAAHFFGHVPVGDKGEPPPTLEYGVESLAFSFAGDARLHRFKPTGQLFFSDWSFDVFSSDGRYAALLESHYGPVDVVATARLRQFLDGVAVPFERVEAPAADHVARVVEHVRWSGPREIEFAATCCGDTEVVRRRIGDGGGTRALQ